MTPNLSVVIGTLKLKNPLLVSSGTFGYAQEFVDFLDLNILGGIVTKTITLFPRQGNRPPRTCETPAGLLNSIGLENPGIKVFIQEKLPYFQKLKVPLIVSIAAQDEISEFVELAEKLDKERLVAAIELNISCPNVRHCTKKSNVKLIAQDAKATALVVKAVKKVTTKPIITKLSPNVTDITEIALAAEEAGSDGVSLVNTITAMAVDVEKRRPKLAMVIGGLSGPAIRPIAVRMVWETYKKVRIPIIGMGGIMDADSALEFILAGASAISVGTANFINPNVCSEILRGICGYMIRHRITSLERLRGAIMC
ncbi:MAG: dihydroorotate dehydrogenase [Candidatus Omnitrophica bacterium]|nr:dihydroorotate dehydrogenase [Candidatus Omnitrophota bacterium]